MTEPTKDTETKDQEVVDQTKDDEAAARELVIASEARQFDKDRQRADQAEANLRKARQEKEQLGAQLAEMQAKHTELSQKVAELTAGKAAEDQVTQLLPEFDPENMTGDEIAKALPQIAKVIRDLNKELATLKTKAERSDTERQQQRQQSEAEKQKNAIFQKVCTRLEGKHGAGLRNRAIEVMEKRIETEGEPATQAEATLMLDECFAQAKEEAKTKEKDKPSRKRSETPTDTGGGGRPTFRNVEIKKGSLDDVAAQVERAMTASG